MSEDQQVNPFDEATGHVANALKVLLVAEDDAKRAPTPDELHDVFYALVTAFVQLKKLPGGEAALEKVYEECRAELRRRGREDIIQEVEGDQ